jgi:hypothetical protein
MQELATISGAIQFADDLLKDGDTHATVCQSLNQHLPHTVRG